MTISELRRWARHELSGAGDTPQLDADLLLAAVLSKRREYLFAEGSTRVSEQEQALFQSYVSRRAKHEPIAYILGKKEFRSFEFKLSPDVLIPRPETEHLVEEALRVFSQLESEEEVLLLDIGTGSGAIVLSLLREIEDLEKIGKALPTVRAYASDVSTRALEIAGENAARLNLTERVEFLEGSLLAGIPESVRHKGTFGLILANLPYIPQSAVLPADVRGYEPAGALFGGSQGEELICRCLHELSRFRPCSRGVALFEIGEAQSETLARTLQNGVGLEFQFLPDLQGIPRILRVNYRDVCG